MANAYILSIDQSTQGSKALLLDDQGALVDIRSKAHKQYIDDKGYVEHDLDEIYANVIVLIKDMIINHPESVDKIKAVGISVQRETVACFSKKTLKPFYHAIVWQCARACELIARENIAAKAQDIRKITGLTLSEYFSAPKMAWLLENIPEVKQAQDAGDLCLSNMDAFLIARLTHGKSFATEPSNASRTMLMDINSLNWSEELCKLFNIDKSSLPEILDSDSNFGMTDFEGILPHAIPIFSAIGDSQGALFGHGALKQGQVKTTYGTGSSIMMNSGNTPSHCENGVVNSVGWRRQGQTTYVLEGNINYSAGIISYLKDDLKLIKSPAETEDLAKKAHPQDKCCFVPALSGLGAPWFNSNARGTILGMSRLTGKNEIVRAALDAITLQVNDILKLLEKSSGIEISDLNVDGGATKNGYLMQRQADLSAVLVVVPKESELSGIGAGLLAGIACGLYSEDILSHQEIHNTFTPKLAKDARDAIIERWHRAVHSALAFGI